MNERHYKAMAAGDLGQKHYPDDRARARLIRAWRAKLAAPPVVEGRPTHLERAKARSLARQAKRTRSTTTTEPTPCN
jgi:hypothetical protein